MARQLRCPRCGSQSLHPVTETTGTTKGYGFGKGCLGAIIAGPIGWLCGLCGMGKGRTTSTTYWMCDSCGKKFRA